MSFRSVFRSVEIKLIYFYENIEYKSLFKRGDQARKNFSKKTVATRNIIKPPVD
jgi:hypothetical protein